MGARFTNYLRKKRENPEFRKREKLAEIAAELRIQLAASGLNQRQLAEKLGVSDQALSKKLSGSANPTLGTLFDLFDALGKDFDFVCREAGAPRVTKTALRGEVGQNDFVLQPYRARPIGFMVPVTQDQSHAANDSWGHITHYQVGMR